MKRDSQREAWTRYFDGGESKVNKYHVAPKDERGKYASRHEAEVAAKLAALERAGKIKNGSLII